MSLKAGQSGVVLVNPRDRRGRPISSPVLAAAEEVGRRAIQHAERLQIDPALAASLLEEAAATVSRALAVRNLHEGPVLDLESYLFRAFLRRLNRAKKRQPLVTVSTETQGVLSRISSDPRRSLEQKLFMDEFLLQCDPVMRDMLCRRVEGCSWKEISAAYGISSHAAESRFSQAIQKIRKKLGLK